MRWQGAIAAIAVLTITAAASAAADIRVQVEESVNEAEPARVVHWFADDRTARDDGSRYIVTRLDRKMTYVIDRESESYRAVDLKLRPEDAIPTVHVERTEDVRTIGEWRTRRYRVTGPATRDLTIDIWVCHDLDVDIEPFRRLMVRLGNRPGSEWLKAYEEIEGFPILQEVVLERPGIRLRSRSRVVSISERKPPPDTYTPPEDFQRVR